MIKRTFQIKIRIMLFRFHFHLCQENMCVFARRGKYSIINNNSTQVKKEQFEIDVEKKKKRITVQCRKVQLKIYTVEKNKNRISECHWTRTHTLKTVIHSTKCSCVGIITLCLTPSRHTFYTAQSQNDDLKIRLKIQTA